MVFKKQRALPKCVCLSWNLMTVWNVLENLGWLSWGDNTRILLASVTALISCSYHEGCRWAMPPWGSGVYYQDLDWKSRCLDMQFSWGGQEYRRVWAKPHSCVHSFYGVGENIMIASIPLAQGATWPKSMIWRSKLPDARVWPITWWWEWGGWEL